MNINETKRLIASLPKFHDDATISFGDITIQMCQLKALADSHDALLLAAKTVADHDKCVLYDVLIEAILKAEPDYNEAAFHDAMEQQHLDEIELEIAAYEMEGE